MNKPHIDVLICTPGRSMESEYVQSLVTTITYLNNKKISYIYTNQYSSNVSASREATIVGSKMLNVFCQEPLNGQITYNKVIWIDSDISWSIDQFMKLYESNLDIVSGVYFDENSLPMFNFDITSKSFDYKKFTEQKTSFKVFGVGFGFVAMKYGVFESIPRPWFHTQFEKVTNNKGQEIFVPIAEDYSWCIKAKNVGYDIYVDPSIKVNHHKKVKIY